MLDNICISHNKIYDGSVKIIKEFQDIHSSSFPMQRERFCFDLNNAINQQNKDESLKLIIAVANGSDSSTNDLFNGLVDLQIIIRSRYDKPNKNDLATDLNKRGLYADVIDVKNGYLTKICIPEINKVIDEELRIKELEYNRENGIF